jgi:outer membrane protein assembly factor BamB
MLAALVGAWLPLAAADWPQYLGPESNDQSPEKIVTPWPADGLKPLWKVPTSDGFSSFAVRDGMAFTLVMRNINGFNREVCVAFDAASGKELWAAPLGLAKYDGGGDSGTDDNKGGDGPRSTPTADSNRVYTLDAHLLLACFDAATGGLVWSKDLVKDCGGKNIPWQSAASPVLDGDRLFVCCGAEGGSLLALNKADGSVLWKGESDAMTQATPVVATILGVRQVIFFTQTGLVATDEATGKVLWRHPFDYRVSTAASPVVAGDMVYCSAGYGVGSAAIKLAKDGDAFKVTQLWRTKGDKIANHWSTPVIKDGHVYGLFGTKEYGKAPLKCVELATGKVLWEQPGFGPGGLILADDHLLVLSDRGELVVVDPQPDGYKELARSKAVDGKCWNHPVIAAGRIYARSIKEGACFDVASTAK